MAPARVFLSSTAIDLVAHREVVDDTLLRLQQQSVVMERFGAAPGVPVAECERLAASCDVLICLVAHRYGYEPEPGRGSITRREVQAAHSAGKLVYAWIVDDGHPWNEAKEQDRLTQPEVLADDCKVADVAAAVKGLQSFKTWLLRNFVCDRFTTPDDLGRKVAIALTQVVGSQSGTSAAQFARAAELRIVHALQPAPHFRGREPLVDMLSAWVDDTASPDRLHALVAVGGTGKTAVAERVVARLRERGLAIGAGSVLVWSFYEKPDADAFLRECAQLFLGEADDAPAGGQLERLLRGLRDGQPHLIVLDGLERVQADAGHGRVRGELEDHQLKLLLQAIAAGLGRTRTLVTSRFPLMDLRDWLHRGMVETVLNDLSPADARQVLRGWGVQGPDAQLDEVVGQVGGHALSVAVVGSYLSHFEAGCIEAARRFDLDAVVGDDPKAAKLARVLAFYADRMPAQERELLIRLSVFPRGITLELLGTLIDAGGQVAGLLVNAHSSLPLLLGRLVERGLVFRYASTDGTLTWTAHPFVRERFAALLDCATEQVFDVVAARLGMGLELRPENKPEGRSVLDRYEQLVEATRLAGRSQEAFDLYWFGLGSYRHLGTKLGEYVRAERILRGFFPLIGGLRNFGVELTERDQLVALNDLGLLASQLGRLHEAAAIQLEVNSRGQLLDSHEASSIRLRNACNVARDRGRLDEALVISNDALVEAENAGHDGELRSSLAQRAYVLHLQGKLPASRVDFASATALEDEPLLYSGRGLKHARAHLDQGYLDACRMICESGLPIAQSSDWNNELPCWYSLFARMALAGNQSPGFELEVIRAWTARTGDMEWILEAHCLAARWALARGDLSTAKAEIDDGLRQARLCGYVLRTIEMLVTLSAIELAWPRPEEALVAAREALDLTTAEGCSYAWGEADAAHAWGLAFEALGQRDNATRAFQQALAVRARIEHPQVQAVRDALARLS